MNNFNSKYNNNYYYSYHLLGTPLFKCIDSFNFQNFIAMVVVVMPIRYTEEETETQKLSNLFKITQVSG